MQIECVPISSLSPDPRNPRTHPKENLDAILLSLKRFGQAEPLVVQRGTRRIIAGHGRLAGMKQLGWSECEIVELDVDDTTAKALGIALNRSGDLGAWDHEALAQLLRELQLEGELVGVGFDDKDLDELLKDLEAEEASSLEDPGASDAVEDPIVVRGDLWRLGAHRLLCGDATDLADVERLLDGQVPLLMVSDPPYGVLYDPAWRNQAGLSSTERTGKVTNDERVDWSAAYQLFPGNVAYIWHAGRFAAEVATSLRASGFEIRTQIIWRKVRFAISRGHYHWQHEPCYYAVRDGQSSKWVGDRKQSTIWEPEETLPKDGSKHGTPKPVDLMEKPIRNHGESSDAVYDPFVGSGTTLIAAERCARACFAMEIESGYAQASIQRWQAMTGKQAVRDGDEVSFDSLQEARAAS